MPFETLAGLHLPLAVVVVVDAEKIERFRLAAELRHEGAGEHVPRLPLVVVDLVGTPGEVRCVRWRHDVRQRLDVQDARARIFGADRLDRQQGSADQPPLRLPADVAVVAFEALAALRLLSIGMDEIALGDRPGEKADLVDRRVDGCAIRHAAQGARRCRCEVCEALREIVGEDIDASREAVVHQRPQHLQAMAVGGVGATQCPAEVEATARCGGGAGRLRQAPADALADRPQAERGHPAVVVVEMREVAGHAHQVLRLGTGVDVVGALEAGHPERCVRIQIVVESRRRHEDGWGWTRRAAAAAAALAAAAAASARHCTKWAMAPSRRGIRVARSLASTP